MPDNTGLLLKLAHTVILRHCRKMLSGSLLALPDIPDTRTHGDVSKKYGSILHGIMRKPNTNTASESNGYGHLRLSVMSHKKCKMNLFVPLHMKQEKLSCRQCMICSGNSRSIKQDIAIVGHGGHAVKSIDIMVK